MVIGHVAQKPRTSAVTTHRGTTWGDPNPHDPTSLNRGLEQSKSVGGERAGGSSRQPRGRAAERGRVRDGRGLTPGRASLRWQRRGASSRLVQLGHCSWRAEPSRAQAGRKRNVAPVPSGVEKRESWPRGCPLKARKWNATRTF